MESTADNVGATATPDGTRSGGRGCVCIVRHSQYPAELNVRREAEALLAAGFEVVVVCLRESGQAAREVIDGVEVRRLPVRHRRGKISRYLFEYNVFFALASIALLRLMLERRLVAVQVNTMPDYLVFAAAVPRLLGVRVVLHLHEPMPELFGTMFDGGRAAVLVKAIALAERLSLGFADRVLTVTDEMRANVCRRGADAAKITVIVNVPDDRRMRLDRFADLAGEVARRREEERSQGVFRVVSHGSIEERYGYDVIVRAIARLRDTIPGLRFRFMGSGSHLPQVLALARELGVEDRVSYLGFVPFETMVEEILAADATVVPMHRNPYSVLVHTNKMFEYMALQRPVVASRLDSVAAYFPHDALHYFEPGDDADLARCLRAIHDEPDDAARRVRAAARIYDTYRWTNEKRKYLAVYDALTGRRATARSRPA